MPQRWSSPLSRAAWGSSGGGAMNRFMWSMMHRPRSVIVEGAPHA